MWPSKLSWAFGWHHFYSRNHFILNVKQASGRVVGLRWCKRVTNVWRWWKRLSRALVWTLLRLEEFLPGPVTKQPLPGITRGWWSLLQVYPINLWREKEWNWGAGMGRQEGREDEKQRNMWVDINDNLYNLGNWLHLFVRAFNVQSQFMPHTYKGYLAKPLPLL